MKKYSQENKKVTNNENKKVTNNDIFSHNSTTLCYDIKKE